MVSRVRPRVRSKSMDARTAASRGHKSKTINWDELEDRQKDNEYIDIVRGYRRRQYNWSGYIHNETINIHTYLWGAVLFSYLLAAFFYPTYVQLYGVTTWRDSAVIAIFLSSAIFCLAASAFYHTSACHSQKVTTRCHAFDYSGIIILIVGSFYPSIYYGFFCHSHVQAFYLATITIAGFGAATIVLNPEYAKPSHRGARTMVFVGLGLGAVVPTTHLLLTHGFNELVAEIGVNWLLTSGALYLGGALL